MSKRSQARDTRRRPKARSLRCRTAGSAEGAPAATLMAEHPAVVLVMNASPERCIELLAEADARDAYSLALQWREDVKGDGDAAYSVFASFMWDEVLAAVVECASARTSRRKDILGSNERLVAEALNRLGWTPGRRGARGHDTRHRAAS